MPFILQDGKLIEVTDAQFAAFGGGEAQLRRTTAADRRRLAAEEAAAGGQNIQTTSQTNAANNQQIINPNTTDNTPGQTLAPVPAPLQDEATTTTGITTAPPIPGLDRPRGFRTEAITFTREELNAAGITNIPPNVPIRAESENLPVNEFQEYTEGEIGDFEPPDTDINSGDDLTVSDTGGVPDQTLADFTGGDTGVPTQTLADLTVSDTGGVPTQSLTDIGGDTGFVPLTQPQEVTDTGGIPTQSLADIGGDTGLLPSEAELQREAAPQADAYIGAGDTGGVPNQSLRQIGGDTGLTPGEIAQQQAATQQQATLDRARAQATLQQQRKQANDGDWRVKLRLAPGAQYLYRAAQPGILQPLAVTDGVVFPYTPSIQTAYKANYSSYDLTHSNYRGYFYQGSQVEDIQITGKFTAQDSNEANYLLAVIHFFRSITKMFYGLDSQRGAPPPLVFLQGLGEYQFNLAPCVVAQFNYTLPDSVDYIRDGSPNINGTNLLQRRNRQDLPTNSFSAAWSRIQNVLGAQGIRKGAISAPPAPPTLGTNRPTYVPTAMEISITLHPIQSRSQVSKQFSLQQYANGDLLKGGFW